MSSLVAFTLFATGCAPAPDHRGSAASGTAPSQPGEGPQGAVSTIAAPPPASGQSEDTSRAGTGRLDAGRRAQLDLPEPGHALVTLPVLTPAQWANPEAVAARFVLIDTNYAAAEDPAAVMARRAFYATPRLAEDLRSSSSGGARLQDRRRQHAVFAGDVASVATTARRDNIAVVAIVARLTPTGDGSAQDELRSYRLTMSLDPSSGHWLVAGVEGS